MNRLVFGLVVVAASLLGATTYIQTLRAHDKEQQARQALEEASRLADEVALRAQREQDSGEVRADGAAQSQEDIEKLKQAELARRQAEKARREAEKAQLQAELAQERAEEARRQALEQLKNARNALAAAKIADNKVPGEFATPTIDLGTVVADVEKSVKFYTEAIGFKELPGFDVSGEFAKDVGLTNGTSLKIHRLALGDGPGATTLKLMELPKEKPKKGDTEFIHSQLGFRYITIMVADTSAALKRLEKAGVKPIAKTPKEIPASIAKEMWLTIVRDPDGNFVELVGPKK